VHQDKSQENCLCKWTENRVYWKIKLNQHSSFFCTASHRSSKWLRAGCRAAAGGGGSHGPERLRWMAATPCSSVLGSGKVNTTGNMKQISAHVVFSNHREFVAVVSDAGGGAAGVTRSQSQCQDLPRRDSHRYSYSSALSYQNSWWGGG